MRCRLAFLLLLILAACTGQEIQVSNRQPEGFAPWQESVPVYRIGPNDKLNVRFRLTPELNETVLVAPDGSIVLRAAGRVQLLGLSGPEAEAAIATAALRVLRNPEVSVGFEEAAASQIFVGGMVRRAGSFPLTGRRGVMEAVLLAGGFENEARMNEVVLIRRNPQSRPMLRTVDLQSFTAAGSETEDVALQPGDIIFVPRSRVAEVALWVDQTINRTIPFSRAFSYSINRIPTAGTGF
ncbi:polysaccharide biosynthesis/export family protein [Sediminicoccus sp. KRV36]|uniref:polysaccharide biosynthesis/export family protein n=1 Tax=Sediminicoccus sp. KRV36 TaxID=3133721 RepID=UPI00200DB672|nr:polysaccharide biosynthesis/export family protein [Sediminicoccus rosea]UPY35792.1 polysaccharide biosynthesis/export family protein [Sediminicoccus rosea]